jgi:hypothetical protein
VKLPPINKVKSQQIWQNANHILAEAPVTNRPSNANQLLAFFDQITHATRAPIDRSLPPWTKRAHQPVPTVYQPIPSLEEATKRLEEGLSQRTGCEVKCYYNGKQINVFHPKPSKMLRTKKKQRHSCKHTNGSCICVCF